MNYRLKYVINRLLAILLVATLGNETNAQEREFMKGTTGISLSYGGSFTGRYYLNEDFGEEAEPEVTAVYSLNIDHNFEENFSLGIAASYQHFRINYDNLEWYDQRDSSYKRSTFYEHISRTNIAFRSLFDIRFGETRTKFYPYLGARLGFSFWRHHHTSPDPDWEDLDLDRNWLSYQIILGFKGYFTRNIGMHFELGLGTPYLWTMGLNFRFGKGRAPLIIEEEPEQAPDYFDQ